MKKFILFIVVIAVVGIGVFVVSRNGQEPEQSQTPTVSGQSMSFKFSSPKKSAHYESNTPAHGAVLAATPINVVIDVNFDLAVPSDISITNNGTEYGMGATLIDNNKLAMRRNVDPTAPDGLYKVSYKACWPDRSCHDGHFEFAIDRSIARGYQDMLGKPEVTIRLSDIQFQPATIKINKGTKVTWVNDETVEHYINTDSHPAHTYYPAQNSRLLKQGDTYSLTFDMPGSYPYHCSAHADLMKGTLVVE